MLFCTAPFMHFCLRCCIVGQLRCQCFGKMNVQIFVMPKRNKNKTENETETKNRERDRKNREKTRNKRERDRQRNVRKRLYFGDRHTSHLLSSICGVNQEAPELRSKCVTLGKIHFSMSRISFHYASSLDVGEISNRPCLLCC